MEAADGASAIGEGRELRSCTRMVWGSRGNANEVRLQGRLGERGDKRGEGRKLGSSLELPRAWMPRTPGRAWKLADDGDGLDQSRGGFDTYRDIMVQQEMDKRKETTYIAPFLHSREVVTTPLDVLGLSLARPSC